MSQCDCRQLGLLVGEQLLRCAGLLRRQPDFAGTGVSLVHGVGAYAWASTIDTHILNSNQTAKATAEIFQVRFFIPHPTAKNPPLKKIFPQTETRISIN
jgi:hypothetical protein